MIDIKHEVDLKNEPIHTDLAIELISNEAKTVDEGIKITDINLSGEEALKINKKKGRYITIEFDDITDYTNRKKVMNLFSDELGKLLNIKDDDLILVIGLGNSKSTPDSLGPLTISKTLITNHLYLYDELGEGFVRVCAICPGVTGETGIETSDMIKSVVSSLNPSKVIVVDALASSSVERVNKTIQITDSGINPGSGIGNKRKEISKDVLGVDVIAVGVPTVVDAASIVSDTINYMYKHFAYEKDNIDKPKSKLAFNVNYLKYGRTLKIKKDDKEKLFGMVGSLSSLETKKLIYEILNPIGYNLMVTPKEEDFVIEKLSELIGEGINKCLHGCVNNN